MKKVKIDISIYLDTSVELRLLNKFKKRLRKFFGGLSELQEYNKGYTTRIYCERETFLPDGFYNSLMWIFFQENIDFLDLRFEPFVKIYDLKDPKYTWTPNDLTKKDKE